MERVKEQIIENFDIWTSPVKFKSNNGRGSNSKREVYGINKLRNLIRGLALSGRLCRYQETYPKDLEKYIAECRENYSQRIRKLKEYKIGKPIISEFSIPENWSWKRVSDLCDLQTGATPSRQKPEYFGGNNRWLVSGDINLEVIHDCEGRITNEGMRNSNCKILPKGTVLIALNGQGKTRASVALLLTEAACNQSLVGIIPFDQTLLNSEFLLLALKYRYFEIREITGQNKRRGLNMGLVAELSVPVPPIEVQHRIVDKVNQLMVLCDQLEQDQESNFEVHNTLVTSLLDELCSSIGCPTKFANLWQLIQDNFEIIFINKNSIDQLKQTILQLAVMGKLVRQDYKDMSAADLTKKMKREKEQLYKEGSFKKQKKLASIHQDEIPFKLPENWEIARLGDLSHIISKGTTPTSIGYNFEDSGVSFVKIENIENGRIDSGSISQFISEETNNALSRSQLKKGDIMFSIAGTIGKTAIVFEEDLPCNTNQGLAFIRGTESIYYPRYLQIQLDSFVAEKTRQRARGGAMPNVSLTDIKELVSPLPPLDEQKRIINKVDELFDTCEQLKENISKKQNTQIRLAESLVEQAFK